MPRAPRIEFENAIYHVMARGNRQEPIVFSDEDRELFVKTLSDACTRSGWEVFAWVLMDNHYHLVFRTPQANLVAGMQWFQNAYTRRLNSRHQLWGHLFGGRYRSILVENDSHGGSMWRDYLTTVIDYVHLNPGRDGLVDGGEVSCADYEWSSVATGYALPPSKRPPWMIVEEGLDLFGYRDSAANRRKFIDRLDDWVWEEKGEPEMEGVSVETRVKRGWFWGSQSFQERMFEHLDQEGVRESRDYQSSQTEQDYNENRALEIMAEAEDFFGEAITDLCEVIRGDWTRHAIAWAIARETTVSQKWIAENVNLKSAANASQQIRRFEKANEKELPPRIRKWKKSRNVA